MVNFWPSKLGVRVSPESDRPLDRTICPVVPFSNLSPKIHVSNDFLTSVFVCV